MSKLLLYNKKVLVITFLFWILAFGTKMAHCQGILKGIPDSLLEKSHVVIMSEKFEFTILDKQKTEEELNRNYIVLKKSNYVPKQLKIYYSDFVKIKKAKVKIYNKNNKLIKKYSLKDFSFKLDLGGAVSVDNGFKYLTLPDITPPYRIEFYYKNRSKNGLFYPDWSSTDTEHTSILFAQLKVIDKMGSNLKYKNFNIPDPKIKNENKTKIYTWEVKNMKAVKFESFNKREVDYFPQVFLASKEFEMHGIEGNFKDWKSVGKWISKLNEGRNNLTEKEKKEIRLLVNIKDTKLDKIKKIYEYLQDNTRYVSIQLGIGGWLPFQSGFVHKKKYGDCKALTFYAKSMLDAVGIPSYYTLVRAGENINKIPSDFPTLKFNHAFLTVPVDSNKIWLECTSQNTPFGYIGYFTDDRYVLVIKENGGELIRTKKYSSKHNVNSVNVNISLSENGSADIILTDKMIGAAIEKDYFFHYAMDVGKQKQKEWLYGKLNYGSIIINEFSVDKLKSTIIPEGKYKVDFSISDFGTLAGENIIIKPFVFNQTDYKRVSAKNRVHSFYLNKSFTLIDTVYSNIPNGYIIKSNPQEFDLTTKFGKYSISFEKGENIISFVRRVEILKGEYDNNKFKDFKTFINTILKKDKQKLIFTKIE